MNSTDLEKLLLPDGDIEETFPVNLEIGTTFEENTNFLNFAMNVTRYDEQKDEDENIGYMAFYVFDSAKFTKLDMMSIADGEMDGTIEALSPFTIHDSEEDCPWDKEGKDENGIYYERNDFDIYGKIAVLGYFRIYPTFRRKGLGSEALEQALRFLKMSGVNFVTVHPSPTVSEEDTLTKEDLYRFYEKNNFSIYKNEEVGLNVITE